MSDALMNSYERLGVSFVRGEGSYIFNDADERFLDCATGGGVSTFGHAHPHLTKTLKDQADRLWHMCNEYESRDQVQLAERLCTASFADAATFGSTEAEAIESAIKLALAFHASQRDDARFRIISFKGSDHGPSLAVPSGPARTDLTNMTADAFDIVAADDEAGLTKLMGNETAAILVEPIQGDAGVNVMKPDFLRLLRKLCDEHGALLIFDETESGMGRTGRLFAHQWADVEPDIMAIARGLGGGYPLSACLATEKVAKSMKPHLHGSTYGNSPLAMAVGNAVMDLVSAPELLDHIVAVADQFRCGLFPMKAKFPDLFERVKGSGLMLGIELAFPATQFVKICLENQLLCAVSPGNIVRLLPPLTISSDEVSEALEKLEAALTASAEVSQ
ncbi:MAG: aspartate aminotransferase family protein [Pseudomonadota bacterium]